MRLHAMLAKAPFARQHGAAARYVFARLRGRPVDIASLATEQRVISPSIEQEVPAAIFHPCELDRVKKVQQYTTWELEKRCIQGGRITHAATSVYKLEDAVVSGSYLYA